MSFIVKRPSIFETVTSQDGSLCKVLNLETRSETVGRLRLIMHNSNTRVNLVGVLQRKPHEGEKSHQVSDLIFIDLKNEIDPDPRARFRRNALLFVKLHGSARAQSSSQVVPNRVTKTINDNIAPKLTKILQVGKKIYTVDLIAEDRIILIKGYRQRGELTRIFDWRISLDELDLGHGESIITAENLTLIRLKQEFSKKKNKRYLKGQIVLNLQKRIPQNQDSSSGYSKITTSSVKISLKIPLKNKSLILQEYLQENPDSGSLCKFEYQMTPWLQKWGNGQKEESKSPMLSNPSSVIEISENVYLNVNENRLCERNFDAELEGLWKDLKKVKKGSVIHILLRLISLGFEFITLLEELGVKEILEDLEKEGWLDGLNYFKATFHCD